MEDFNGWKGNRHPMRPRGASGVWELFVPGVAPGAHHKYRIFGPRGDRPADVDLRGAPRLLAAEGRAHQAGIGVVLDWVPGHFPTDPHGLGHFDGTHLYEHADPRKGRHPDSGTYIFNYGRDEGQWIPNEYGGRENIDTEFIQSDPLFRSGQHRKLTFSMAYAFAERFLLPFSHDEVVHLKGSMLRKMPGSLLDQPLHAGVHAWVSALNALYRKEPALHASDFTGDRFEWIDCHDQRRTTIAYLRWSPGWKDFVVVVCNFTPVPWKGYRLAVPHPGRYEVLLDSGAEEFGGARTLEADIFEAVEEPHMGRDQHIELTLPPLSTLGLKLRPAAK